MTGVQFSARTMMEYFSLPIRQGSRLVSNEHRALFLRGGEAAMAWSWPLTSI